MLEVGYPLICPVIGLLEHGWITVGDHLAVVVCVCCWLSTITVKKVNTHLVCMVH